MADARLRRDVAWNLAPVALLAAVGLGMNFLIARWWGAEALGVFNLVSIAYFVAAVIGAYGLQYSVLRAVAEAPDERERVAAVVVGALVPSVVLAAGVTGVFLAVRTVISQLLGNAAIADGMLYAAPGLFCFSVNKVLFGVVNGLRRMRAFAIYTSLRYVLIAIGLVLVRTLNVAPAHLAVIWTFAEGGLLLVLAFELVATVALARGAGWRRWTREHVEYGARGVTATLAFEINNKLDVWMLGVAHVDTALIGVYSLAAALNEGAMQLPIVLANNLNPIMARDLAAGRTAEVETLARRTRRWFVPAFAAACAIGAVLYPIVVPWLLGGSSLSDVSNAPAFALGSAPFAILMTGQALSSPYQPFNQVMLMANRPEWHTVLVVLVAAINFSVQLLLIPRFGLHGAALATATAAVCAALLVRRLARARAGVRI